MRDADPAALFCSSPSFWKCDSYLKVKWLGSHHADDDPMQGGNTRGRELESFRFPLLHASQSRVLVCSYCVLLSTGSCAVNVQIGDLPTGTVT